jgi:DNA-binding NarL/FixJ family response regulator
VLWQEQPRCRVVAQYGEGGSALQFIQSHKPDIAILDLNLPELFTLEIARRLREAHFSTRIVVLSTRKDRKTVVEALRAGVNAFLLKSGPAYHLREALSQILDDGVFI